MLARVQTLCLLVAAILAFTSSFLPFWTYASQASYVLSDFFPQSEAGIVHLTTLYLSSILSPLTGIGSVAAIFLYSNRKLQTTVISVLIGFFLADLLSGLTAAHFLNVWLQQSAPAAVEHSPGAGLFVMLPLPLLYWLAMKGVQKDEKIANAYKRL
ncbi:DUF4293 domain-containing protein [Prosthecochloris sp. N3]|uniref:DUF4293 domain-containing protein n=1 Tax=Prosthecochloris ethylica TaxID=2743976 RepID=A0ABR9XRM7_9CHLB|nr:DUF4293 domain-containing protein [Prosthecochloris ethylica]MBF0586744.1 DUF4293 domain-containing protein [Prosthecochloris ethylica]MBF0636650.1 DUF4293 domain-containing protein [Prosthecochloris ethylica]NUK47951.1 DUF4293 domain-containing protein [Prosthecochloris ethylica]